MSVRVLERLQAQFGQRMLACESFRGDDEALVQPLDWLEIAAFLRDDGELAMNQWVDLTAVDYPERMPELPRFEVLLSLRAWPGGQRIRLKTRLGEEQPLATLSGLWVGANWAEREVYDMFGIVFAGHPDLRRILLYEEFVGHPLRKDYPIERAQPLVPYRDVEGVHKLPPFGLDEGQPWGRVQWPERLQGEDRQVSPAIAWQTGQRQHLSQSDAERSPTSEENHDAGS